MNQRELQEEVVRLLPARKGHFRLESGHHGDLWLDLELLCLQVAPVQRLAKRIATKLDAYRVEIVCGPLVEGAFVALMVAAELGVPFTYAERFDRRENGDRSTDPLYGVHYRLPRVLRHVVRGKRVAIVNDVINAGSAIQGTFADLRACGAETLAIAALAALGTSAAKFAAENEVTFKTLANLPNQIWTPAECPLCRSGIPLEDRHTP